jgi:lactate 2-monooxygenase
MHRKTFISLLGAGSAGLSLPASLAGLPGAGRRSLPSGIIPGPGIPTGDDPVSMAGIGMNRQISMYMAGLDGIRPGYPVSPEGLDVEAAGIMNPEAYDYVAGGAGSENTVSANRLAFMRQKIVPRMLRDVSVRSMEVQLFGRTYPSPFILAPIGVQSILHSDAESATAAAAAETGVPMVLSTVSSRPIESIGQAAGQVPNWFQLYWPRNPELALSLVIRAKNAGFGAIVITLDTHLLAWRERDLQNAYLPFLRGEGLANYFTDPVFTEMLDRRPEENPEAAIQLFADVFSNPSLTWNQLQLIRKETDLPILLKGILSPDDARLAIQHGADGIIVSNHGGRQLDGAIAALDALPEVVKAADGKVPVLFDSGIRRGADAFIALAMGARAVLLGRPYAFGLALNGQQGVKDVILNILADFDLTMGLAGCKSVAEIGPEMIRASAFP